MDEQRAVVEVKKEVIELFKGERIRAYTRDERREWLRRVDNGFLVYSVDCGLGARERRIPTKIEEIPGLDRDVKEEYNNVHRFPEVDADHVVLEKVHVKKTFYGEYMYASVKTYVEAYVQRRINGFTVDVCGIGLDPEEVESYVARLLELFDAPGRIVEPKGPIAFVDFALMDFLSFLEQALDGQSVKEGVSFLAYSTLPENFIMREIPHEPLVNVTKLDDDFVETKEKTVLPMYDFFRAAEYGEKPTGNGFFVPDAGHGVAFTNVLVQPSEGIGMDEFTGVLTNSVLGFHTSSVETGELRLTVAQGVQYIKGEPVGFVKNIPVVCNVLDLMKSSFYVGDPMRNSNYISPVLGFYY